MSTSATSSPPTPLPPHTVRIKRKRNQDPLQALILNQDSSSKRSRTNSYVFKLATTEEQPRRPGAITLLEAPILPDDPSPSSLPTTTTTTTSAKEHASGILKAARDILSPARLFRFPTRKRRISNDNDLESSAKPTETSSRKRTRATPVSQSEKIRSNTTQGGLPPPPIKPAEDSIARQSPRASAGGIPKVKVLATPPPARSPMPSSSSSITPPAPVPVPITGVRTNTTTASGEPARRRRRSSGSLSLSPTNSYQQMSTANEEELQHMVDIYLQLNNNNTNSSRTSDSPSGEKNAGNQTKLTSELKRPNRASSRRASLKAASEAVPEAVIVDDEEEHAPKPPADDEGLVHKAPVVSSIKEEEAVDGEVEDYVYDVYYREKMLGSTWEGGQYGLLLYNTEQDFEDLIFDENDDGDNSDYGLSDDEDSNAEDYYGNDYPDEEDFEEEEDEETEFVSEGRSGLGAEAEEGGEAEIDADDFDGYEYEECAPRFADDDGDRSMEGGVGLQDIMELEDSAESDSDFAERILSSLRQKDGYEDAEE